MFRRLSIHSKLTLALSAMALATFVVAGVALVFFGNLTLRQRAHQTLEPYAQLVSVGAEAAVRFEDAARAEEILNTLRANPQILKAEILLRDGRPLAGYNSQPDSPRRFDAPQPDGIYVGADSAELIQTLPEGARLHLLMSLSEIKQQTTDLVLALAAGLLGLLVAINLGLRATLKRSIVEPISTLADTVEQVRSKADYHQRVPGVGADEVARLGRSFNAMMGAVEERDRELRELSVFQQTLLDNAAYGIISATPDGIVSSFNPAAERLLGYTAAEVVGKLSPARWHDPAEVARHAQRLSQELGEAIPPGFEVFAARPKRNLREENEWTFLRKDGTRVPVLLSVTALRDGNGQITGFLGLVHDLTERKRNEAALRQLNQELEQRVRDRTAHLELANQGLESFSYSVSHDLRAPLRSIDGFSRVLFEDYAERLDADAKDSLQRIRAASQRMGHLIDDLLKLAHVSRGEMRRGRVDLSALARTVAEELRRATPERQLEFVIAPDQEANGDARLLRVVLENLLGNACKFSSQRPVSHIEFGATQRNGTRAFFVRDNGAGFDPVVAGKMFEPFRRFHTDAEFPGTGIGLATVQRIIRRHGGTIFAESQPDAGATFYFTLPDQPSPQS